MAEKKYFSLSSDQMGVGDDTKLYDIDGNRIIPADDQYVKISDKYGPTNREFNCGLCLVSDSEYKYHGFASNQLWGAVDMDGNEVIPCIYNNMTDYKHGYSVVWKRKWGHAVLDTKGKIVYGPYEHHIIEVCYNEVSDKAYFIVTNTLEASWDEYERKWHGGKHDVNENGEIVMLLYGKSIIIPRDYDWCDYSFKGGYLSVCKHNLWGVVDINLDLVIPCLYNEKIIFNNGFAQTTLHHKKVILNTNGDVILSTSPNHNISYDKGTHLFVCEYRDSYNYESYDCSIFDDEGNLLVSSNGICESNGFLNVFNLSPIDSKYIAFGYEDEKGKTYVGVCDNRGQIIFYGKFGNCKGISYNLACVLTSGVNGSWGYCDLKGNMVIDAIYEDAMPFSNGVARVKKNGHWGLITPNGYKLTDFVYDEISEFEDGKAIVSQNNPKRSNVITEQGEISYNYKDEYGECEIHLRGYDFCDIGDKYVITSKGTKQGILLRETGEETCPLIDLGETKICFGDDDDLILINDNLRLPINEKGEIKTLLNDKCICLPQGVQWCNNWVDSCIIIQKNGKYGAYNEKLNFILEAKYEYLQSLGDSKIMCKEKVSNKDVFSIYDIKSHDFFRLDYSSCSEFNDGVAIVKKRIVNIQPNLNGSSCVEYVYGLIDRNGNEILPCKYQEIHFHSYPKFDSYSYNDNDFDSGYDISDVFDGDPDAYWNIY